MPFSNPDRGLLLQELLPAVQKNCWISDAAHSGFYSLCGLFLRLKDQFLWEKDLPPWTETDKEGLDGMDRGPGKSLAQPPGPAL